MADLAEIAEQTRRLLQGALAGDLFGDGEPMIAPHIIGVDFLVRDQDLDLPMDKIKERYLMPAVTQLAHAIRQKQPAPGAKLTIQEWRRANDIIIAAGHGIRLGLTKNQLDNGKATLSFDLAFHYEDAEHG